MPTFSRKALLGISAAIAALTLAGAAPAKEVTIAHAKGQTLLEQAPKKVAVYDLATLDILNALGVDAVAGVPKGADGNGNLPPHLARYAAPRYANVGTLFEPDTAALAALKPDLVIIGGRSARKYVELAGLAPTIDLSSQGGDLAATVIDHTRKLGHLFGVEEQAGQRVTEFEAAVSELHAEAGRQGTGLLLFSAGQGVAVHAPGDRFGHVYDFIGIRSAVPAVEATERSGRAPAGSPEAELAHRQQQQKLEAGLSADPHWIFVIDRSAATGTAPSTARQTLAQDPRISATSAWKAGRVVYLDPKTWYLVGAGIDALSQSAKATLASFKAAN
ncbi:siderophore ABC transporter substrate-binding protein [Novosphingobium panipatense]|uniref:siderophore ABC transporter substrate-binding protein n=1 Tax=Novosphingobium TaxID=165696 RepID=UPI000CDA17A4|nr:ABC transporter substrate-binding protein [Novosphingobium sp. HII-3]